MGGDAACCAAVSLLRLAFGIGSAVLGRSRIRSRRHSPGPLPDPDRHTRRGAPGLGGGLPAR